MSVQRQFQSSQARPQSGLNPVVGFTLIALLVAAHFLIGAITGQEPVGNGVAISAVKTVTR